MNRAPLFALAALGLVIIALGPRPVLAQSGCGWSALGSGLADPFASGGGWVTTLAAFDDGGGSQLYAAGNFLQAGGVLVPGLARWNGSVWSALPTPPPSSYWQGPPTGEMAMEVLDDGTGSALYVGTRHVLRWDGVTWSWLGQASNDIVSFELFDDGTGLALYVAGEFSAIGNGTGPCSSSCPLIGRWNGAVWSTVGSIPSSWLWLGDIEVFDDGTGPALYAAGTIPGGVVRWNGSSWSVVGGGLNNPGSSLAVHDDGNGPALYATGGFSIGGTTGVARWDGTSWSAVGAGLGGPVSDADIAVFDDGSGPALFVLDMTPSLRKWDGTSWSQIVSIAGSSPTWITQGLEVYDDGVTAGLFAGAQFSSVAGVPANNIARWSCAPQVPQYQTNNVLATLALNGVWGTPYAAATVTVPVNAPVTLSLTSLNVGMFWELGFGLAPLVPVGSGALVTAGNQFLNLDLTDPTFATLWNLFQGPGFQNVVIPFSVPSPVGLSAQMLVLEPGLPSGVALSQPSRLVVQ